jgi:NADPH:quinone reductase-like Zn-dependent oxidoreductase
MLAMAPLGYTVVAAIRRMKESAVQFSLNPVTAWAILDELGVRAGDWSAVNAATSSIARLVHGLWRGRRVNVPLADAARQGQTGKVLFVQR